MNISHDGMTVSFKTVSEELFLAEKSGAKPNTVRIIDHYEYKQLKKKQPEKIMIRHGQALFLRTVTHIYVSEMILGKYLAIFSWTNVKHHHTTSSETDHGPGDHTLSLDPTEEPPIDMSTIDLPKSLINRMGRYIGNDTFPEFISKLLNDIPHVQPQLQSDKRFVCVTISKKLHRSLEAIGHGRSMNMVIQETYEAYCYKQDQEKEAVTEEPGPDRRIALIAISKGMMDTLTNIAHGRSTDRIIRDLYQRSLDEERVTPKCCLRNGEKAIATVKFEVAGAPPLQVQAINISTSLLKMVDKYRGDHSYDKFIRILLANFYDSSIEASPGRTITMDEVQSIPKSTRCSNCDGDILEVRTGKFGRCNICGAIYRLSVPDGDQVT